MSTEQISLEQQLLFLDKMREKVKGTDLEPIWERLNEVMKKINCLSETEKDTINALIKKLQDKIEHFKNVSLKKLEQTEKDKEAEQFKTISGTSQMMSPPNSQQQQQKRKIKKGKRWRRTEKPNIVMSPRGDHIPIMRIRMSEIYNTKKRKEERRKMKKMKQGVENTLAVNESSELLPEATIEDNQIESNVENSSTTDDINGNNQKNSMNDSRPEELNETANEIEEPTNNGNAASINVTEDFNIKDCFIRLNVSKEITELVENSKEFTENFQQIPIERSQIAIRSDEAQEIPEATTSSTTNDTISMHKFPEIEKSTPKTDDLQKQVAETGDDSYVLSIKTVDLTPIRKRRNTIDVAPIFKRYGTKRELNRLATNATFGLDLNTPLEKRRSRQSVYLDYSELLYTKNSTKKTPTPKKSPKKLPNARKSTSHSAPKQARKISLNQNEVTAGRSNSIQVPKQNEVKKATNSRQSSSMGQATINNNILNHIKQEPCSPSGNMSPPMTEIPSHIVAINAQKDRKLILLSAEFTLKKIRPWMKISEHRKYLKNCEQMLGNALCLSALFKCMGSTCSYYTNNSSVFLKHLNLHKKFQPNDIKNYSNCAYCNYINDDIEKLISHIVETHGCNKYQCSYCFYRRYDSQIHTHYKLFHPLKQEVMIECETTKNASIEKEFSIVWNNSFNVCRPIICCMCKKKFYNTNQFETHLNSYEFIPQSRCLKCKFLTSKESYMDHLKNCHGFGNHNCAYCTFSSDSLDSIRIHLSNSHCDKPLLYFDRSIKIMKADASQFGLKNMHEISKFVSLKQFVDQKTKNFTQKKVVDNQKELENANNINTGILDYNN